MFQVIHPPPKNNSCMHSMPTFFSEGTVTIPAIWLFWERSVFSYLWPRETVTLSWTAEYIPTFVVGPYWEELCPLSWVLELGREIKMIFVLSRAWDKENFWVPMTNRTSELRIPLSDALRLSLRDSMVSEVSYEVSFDFGLVTSVGQGKLLSPHEESNLRPSDSALRCSTTESQRLHGKRSLWRSSYDTRPAYCED